MAPKERKAAPAEEAPEAKKARVDEPAKEKEPVKKKYQEPDAPQDTRPALKEKIGFATANTSSNVVPTMGGKVFTCLTDGGMSSVMASARAGVGQKAGRYMFEAKILQVTDPHQGQLKSARIAARIGFSTSSSSLMIGEDVSSIYFDAEGFCIAAKKNIKVPASRFDKGQVVAVVLNLDDKSPNFNTLALFRDGVAVGDPVPLPEDLKGKTLFPHLSYCKVSVQVNFGPTALKELPFKCALLQAAAAADVTVSRFAERASKGGKGRMRKAQMRKEKARKGGEARKLKLAADRGPLHAEPTLEILSNDEGDSQSVTPAAAVVPVNSDQPALPLPLGGGLGVVFEALPVEAGDHGDAGSEDVLSNKDILSQSSPTKVDQQAAASMHAKPAKSSPLASMVVCAKAAVMGPAVSPAPPLAEDARTPFVSDAPAPDDDSMDITDEELYLPHRLHDDGLADAAFQAVEDAREALNNANDRLAAQSGKNSVLRFQLGFGVGCVLTHLLFVHFLAGS